MFSLFMTLKILKEMGVTKVTHQAYEDIPYIIEAERHEDDYTRSVGTLSVKGSTLREFDIPVPPVDLVGRVLAFEFTADSDSIRDDHTLWIQDVYRTDRHRREVRHPGYDLKAYTSFAVRLATLVLDDVRCPHYEFKVYVTEPEYDALVRLPTDSELAVTAHLRRK